MLPTPSHWLRRNPEFLVGIPIALLLCSGLLFFGWFLPRSHALPNFLPSSQSVPSTNLWELSHNPEQFYAKPISVTGRVLDYQHFANGEMEITILATEGDYQLTLPVWLEDYMEVRRGDVLSVTGVGNSRTHDGPSIFTRSNLISKQ